MSCGRAQVPFVLACLWCILLNTPLPSLGQPGNGADKIVIVSNYTQTLDLIGKMCNENGWGFCRLDGSVGMKKRQKMCDDFNNPSSNLVAFLLSSKAGGCGLNLIGGNRLVLFDPDWNPAVDKQAAARCWRDGQKKRCFTYRFLTSGSVEEKIFQRQLSKEGLQSVVDDKEQVNSLSTKDLRNLFTLRSNTPSDTHDKLQCQRCKIVQDDAESEAVASLPFKLLRCGEILEEMMGHSEAEKFITPLNPETYNVTSSDYDAVVKQPMDLERIKANLNKAGHYNSISQFSKDVNRIFSNVAKVWDHSSDIGLSSGKLQAWWLAKWNENVSTIMAIKAPKVVGNGNGNHISSSSSPKIKGLGGGIPTSMANANSDSSETGTSNECFSGDTSCAAADEVEKGEHFQEQIGMPDEEDMRDWSHHFGADTCDDPVFRAAMQGTDSVSFVFGLEVTWDLITSRKQEEEEQRALEELARLEAEEEKAEIEAAQKKTENCLSSEDDEDEDEDEDNDCGGSKQSKFSSVKTPNSSKVKKVAKGDSKMNENAPTKKVKEVELDSNSDDDDPNEMRDFVVDSDGEVEDDGGPDEQEVDVEFVDSDEDDVAMSSEDENDFVTAKPKPRLVKKTLSPMSEAAEEPIALLDDTEDDDEDDMFNASPPRKAALLVEEDESADEDEVEVDECGNNEEDDDGDDAGGDDGGVFEEGLTSAPATASLASTGNTPPPPSPPPQSVSTRNNKGDDEISRDEPWDGVVLGTSKIFQKGGGWSRLGLVLSHLSDQDSYIVQFRDPETEVTAGDSFPDDPEFQEVLTRSSIIKGLGMLSKKHESEKKKAERERKKREKEAGKENSVVKWACGVCTFENTARSKKCKICKADKPVAKRPASGSMSDSESTTSSKRSRRGSSQGGGVLGAV